MALSDSAIKAAKATNKPRKLADERGLYLLVRPGGARWWRFDYRFDGKRKTLALGVYPDVSLKTVRERRDEARRLVAAGVDPGEHRKAARSARSVAMANSFEAVAREWLAKQSTRWAASHASKVSGRLEKDVFPWLKARPVAELTAPELLTVVRRIEARGAVDTAHRVLQNLGQIMRYAVATSRAERDPSGDLRGALAPVTNKHFPALTEPEAVGAMLRAFDAFSGTLQVQAALRLAPLVFVRPGELRGARWVEFDLDRAEWVIPAERMKARRPHLVPLSTQAVAILRDLAPLSGHRAFVFPGRDPKKAMSEAAINAALRRLGFDTQREVTGHGFRAMARTLLHEQLHFPPEVIEHQLAHSVADPLGAAYNRTRFVEQRREMMQRWADYLDRLKSGGEVLTFPASAMQGAA